MQKKTCENCKKNIATVFLENSFCSRCFAKIFEKRVDNHLRKSIEVGDYRIILFLDKKAKSTVSSILVKRFLKMRKIDFEVKKLDAQKMIIDRTTSAFALFPLTGDDLLAQFVDEFSSNYSKPINKVHSKEILILQLVSDREVKEYCKIKSILIKKEDFIKEKNLKKIDEGLRELKKKYPQTVHSFSRSIEKLREITDE